MQYKFSGFMQSTITLFIIASLLVCIACNVSESNRFYFAAVANGEISLEAQYLASSSSFQYDFVGEETIKSTNTSYSNLTRSIMRNQRNGYQNYLFFTCLLICAFFLLKNNLRSYVYVAKQTKNFTCLRIARFIEHSDGKK